MNNHEVLKVSNGQVDKLLSISLVTLIIQIKNTPTSHADEVAKLIKNEIPSQLLETAEDFFQKEIDVDELLEEFKESLDSAQTSINLFDS
jgi:hypothetical protein